MPLIFLCGLVAIALWSLVEHRFERYGVAGPAALTLAGARGKVEHTIPHTEVMLVEEVGILAANLVWFVLGAMTVVVMVFTVVGSIALHGVLAPQIVRRRMPRTESSAASADHL